MRSVLQYLHNKYTAHINSDEWTRLVSIHKQERVENMMSVAKASQYFGLHGLQHEVSEGISFVLANSPVYALMALNQATGDDGASVPSDIMDKIMETIRVLNADTFEDELVDMAYISAATIERILSEKIMYCSTQYDLFRLLLRWSNAADNGAREPIAQTLSQKIDFRQVSAKQLATDAAASNIVSRDQLFEAYKHQALVACSPPGNTSPSLCVNILRSGAIWQDDEMLDKRFFLVQCPIMISGINVWSILQCGSGEELFNAFGIALPQKLKDGKKGAWLYAENGSYYFDHPEDGRESSSSSVGRRPDFQFGISRERILTFQLDLRRQSPRNGTLAASLDNGKKFFTLFTDLRKHIKDNEGFVPIASLDRPSHARLVDCQMSPKDIAALCVVRRANE
eukprot:CAMPEP_0172467646 /NCGR_PEP_ID=MMETSP1065-20121228/59478_1 /TAXON_ID=265537 /ORGANISM="Amphiprora paludosa, Strain CCMP125" /LENGTH=396 /DNA_ID=CAMNT_0013224855 /DNA_START=25 /DNA_END=1215 /DNA_ORIENTATION=+